MRPLGPDQGLDPEEPGQRLLRQNRGRVAIGGEPTGMDQSDSIRETGGEREVVHHGDDGCAGCRAAAEDIEGEQLMARIERRHGLVGEEHSGFRRERPGEQHPRPLAAGDPRDGPILEALEADVADRCGDRAPARLGQSLGAFPMRQAPERHDVPHGQRPGDGAALGQKGDAPGALASRQGGERRVVKPDRAASGREKAGEGAQKRGLASAVRADDDGQAGRFQGQVDPGQDVAAAEPDGQSLGAQTRHGGSAKPACRRATTQRNTGTPRKAVRTPILTSTAEGISRTAMSAAKSSAAPASAEGRRVRAGS